MTILETGTGTVSGNDYLPARAEEVFWGRLPCATDRAVISVDPGSTLTIDTLSHEGLMEDQGRDPRQFFAGYGVEADQVLAEAVELAASGRVHPADDGPHVVTGPIEIPRAQPGDLLAITVLETLRRVPYGVISNRHGRGALPGEMPEADTIYNAFAGVEEVAGTAYGVLPRVLGGEATVSFELHPFLGIMGVAVAGDSRPHSVPPGAHGGNLDINLLTVGSTLYLPVQVPGALAYFGDPHFAQGDGEVALTAMEASLRATLRFDVVAAGDVAALFGADVGPIAETRDFLVPTGLDADLDVAVQNCVRAALGLLEARYGMDRAQAYAYLSAATDFNISQVVDLVKGVHARIRKDDFR
jgi:acetamidase/formamidase